MFTQHRTIPACTPALPRTIGTLFAATALLFLVGACGSREEKGPDGEKKKEIMVFAAASLRNVLEELGKAYEQETGTHVLFNFAGSDQLAHQAIASRVPDLFLSASVSWMDSVEKAGRVVAGTRADLLSNMLVVITDAKSTWTMNDPCALASIPYKHLSLADPESVPAGQYARKWMRSVTCGTDTLWNRVKERVVPAPDVRAALALVLADPDVISIVYKSDHHAYADRTRLLYEVKEGPPIRYVLAQLAGGGNPDGAHTFAEMLKGPKGQAAFAKHGFIPLSSSTPAP